MTDVPPKKPLSPWLILLAAALAPFLVASCSSTPKIQGLPDKLPDIALNGSSATPPHNLPTYEYPFDANGNYVSTWAAEGERRAGRPAMATNDDERKWSGSHRGHATGKSPKRSTSKKGSGKSSSSGKSKKKKSSDDDVKPKSKSGSSSKSKSSSSSKKKSSTSKSGGSGSGSKSGATKKKSSGATSSTKPKSKSGSGTGSSSSKKKKKSND
jgi:hypothetical protein